MVAANVEPARLMGVAASMAGASSVSLARAGFREAADLAAIWRRVARSSYWRGAVSASGREGSPAPGQSAQGMSGPADDKWHMRMMFAGRYFKIMTPAGLVGGALVLDRGRDRREIAFLFIDPRHQSSGVGRLAVRRLEEAFPAVVLWLGEVPEWNFRARRFLERLGYRRWSRRPGAGGRAGLSYEKRVFA